MQVSPNQISNLHLIDIDNESQRERVNPVVFAFDYLKQEQKKICIAAAVITLLLFGIAIGYALGSSHGVIEVSTTESSAVAEPIIQQSTTLSPTTPSWAEESTEHFPVATVEPPTEIDLAQGRETVRQMTRDAWSAYVKYAWNSTALKPKSGKPWPIDEKKRDRHGYYHTFWSYPGLGVDTGSTILESLSTLWILDLKDEYEQGRKWVEEQFTPWDGISNSHQYSEYHTFYLASVVKRYLGSLLSCFALTGNDMFYQKAVKLANSLKPAYESTSKVGLPPQKLIYQYQSVTTQTDEYYLEETGGQYLELQYLSDLSEADKPYYERFWKIANDRLRHKTNELFTVDGAALYRTQYNASIPNVGLLSLQKHAAGFFSHTIKSIIQANGTAAKSPTLDAFVSTIERAEFIGLIDRSSAGWTYLRDRHLEKERFDNLMSAEGCSWGAILALTGWALKRSGNSLETALSEANETTIEADRLIELAEELTKTCQAAAEMRKEGLLPREMYFNHKGVLHVKESDPIDLSPELAESFFVLSRVSDKTSQYRQYAWEMVQAIKGNTATLNGGFSNVGVDFQEPSLLGGTFKYLYLIFSEKDTLPLDKWVFNSVGQPLPVCGTSIYYPAC